MEDIEIKSIGELIDALITCDLKCFHAQDDIMNESLSNEKRLEAAINAQKNNKKRSILMNAINQRLGENDPLSTRKTY